MLTILCETENHWNWQRAVVEPSHRSDDICGRALAYHKAVDASEHHTNADHADYSLAYSTMRISGLPNAK